MATGAQRPSCVMHDGLLVLTVIGHDLKLEPAGCLVVADDLEHLRPWLVTEEKPVLEPDPQWAAPGFGLVGHGDDDAGRAEIIGRCGFALKGTSQGNQCGVERGMRHR